MKRRWISAALATAVIWGACAIGGAPGQEGVRRAPVGGAVRPQAAIPAGAYSAPSRPASPGTAAAQAFGGKLVAVSLSGAKQPKLLEQARFVEIKGRTFLVGKEARAMFSFPLGTDAHVAWDAVESFYLFDNVEQYESALRSALQSVQGSMDDMFGEILPGANVSGVHVNSPFGEAQPAPRYQEFPADALPTSQTPVDESGSPLVESFQTPNRRTVRVRRRIVIEGDGREREVQAYEQVKTAEPGERFAPPSTYSPIEERAQPTAVKPKTSPPRPAPPRHTP